jgi:methylglutaconyl-CoA hydratase
MVNIEIDNGVGTITFGTEAHNSLPSSVLQELTEAINSFGNNPAVKVIVLKSQGEKTFCAGASFDELAAIQDEATGLRFFSGFANVINACRKCPKFIIGRIQGKAVGGGVGLASAMDYAVATEQASVKLSELAVGIGPFVVGPAVQRKMGFSAMSELAINATEWRTAKWAKERGLYQEVFDTIAQVDAYVLHLAEILKAHSPEAMADLKRVFWEGCETWDDFLIERAAISGKLVLSDYTKNAIQKFKNG